MQCKIHLARFPYKRAEDPMVTDWFAETLYKAKTDPRISQVTSKYYDDTPIPMTRNLSVEDARGLGADFLLMIDNDMGPDILRGTSGAKPFWDTTLDFMLAHNGPCVVGAPYTGPPPHSNVYVFRWANERNFQEPQDMQLVWFAREEAAKRKGFEQVGALPTGLIMIDMRVFPKNRGLPYFYYEWKDATESKKASTEDVTFTRDCALYGFPIYVNWDAWARHYKWVGMDKPRPITIEQIRKNYTDAVRAGLSDTEKLVMVGEGDPDSLANHLDRVLPTPGGPDRPTLPPPKPKKRTRKGA